MSADTSPGLLHPQEGILALIRMSVALAVSVLVVGRVFGALPQPEGALSAAYASVEALTASAFELAPILLLIVVAGIVARQVRRA